MRGMSRQEWESSGIPEKIRTSLFGFRREGLVAGDFGREKFSGYPPSIRGVYYDSPPESNDWNLELAQQVEREIQGLKSPIATIGSKLALPREQSGLNDLERSVVEDLFGGNLENWNEYLQQIQSRYGQVNALGVAYYSKEAGIINFGAIHEILEKMHQKDGLPRLEIGCFEVNPVTIQLGAFSWSLEERARQAVYVMKDSIDQDGGSDCDVDFIQFQRSMLQNLAESALDSEGNTIGVFPHGPRTTFKGKGPYSPGTGDTYGVQLNIYLTIKDGAHSLSIEPPEPYKAHR